MVLNKVEISYNDIEDNNIKYDTKKALSIILDDSTNKEGYSFMINPKALNSLLKALESVNAVDKIVIVPTIHKGDCMYIITKCFGRVDALLCSE